MLPLRLRSYYQEIFSMKLELVAKIVFSCVCRVSVPDSGAS